MIPTQVKIGIGIAIIAALGIMGWQLHAQVKKNGQLSADLDTALGQIDTLDKQIQQNNEQAAKDLAARDAATDEARQQAAANARRATELAQQLHEARADAELSHCLDMRVPDAISLPE